MVSEKEKKGWEVVSERFAAKNEVKYKNSAEPGSANLQVVLLKDEEKIAAEKLITANIKLANLYGIKIKEQQN
jgi:hypothetical protein